MGARQKLNSAYLMGNFILAALAAGVTGSLLVGVITFALGVVGSLAAGEIRPGSVGSGAGPFIKSGHDRVRGSAKKFSR